MMDTKSVLWEQMNFYVWSRRKTLAFGPLRKILMLTWVDDGTWDTLGFLIRGRMNRVGYWYCYLILWYGRCMTVYNINFNLFHKYLQISICYFVILLEHVLVWDGHRQGEFSCKGTLFNVTVIVGVHKWFNLQVQTIKLFRKLQNINIYIKAYSFPEEVLHRPKHVKVLRNNKFLFINICAFSCY